MGGNYTEHAGRCCVRTDEEGVIWLIYDVGHNHIGGCDYFSTFYTRFALYMTYAGFS